MPAQKSKNQALPTAVQQIGARLQKVINTPTAQKDRAALLYKSPDEQQEDWDLIIEAILETDGVDISYEDDGAVRVRWEKLAECKQN